MKIIDDAMKLAASLGKNSLNQRFLIDTIMTGTRVLLGFSTLPDHCSKLLTVDQCLEHFESTSLMVFKVCDAVTKNLLNLRQLPKEHMFVKEILSEFSLIGPLWLLSIGEKVDAFEMFLASIEFYLFDADVDLGGLSSIDGLSSYICSSPPLSVLIGEHECSHNLLRIVDRCKKYDALTVSSQVSPIKNKLLTVLNLPSEAGESYESFAMKTIFDGARIFCFTYKRKRR